MERWKERTLYDQERKTSELEQRSQQIKAEEKSLKEFEIKLREYSRELSEQHTELDSEKAKAQNMIAQAEAAIKESEIRVEELSKSNLQLKNQIQRLIPKSRQYSENEEFRFDSYVKKKRTGRHSFNGTRNASRMFPKKFVRTENGRKRGKKLKSKTLRKTKSRGLAVAGRSAP